MIYLDYAATTPVDPRVAEQMMQYLTQDGDFGNASSTHTFGTKAREAVEKARSEVATLIHADPKEIIWTSGATEANNLALKGAAQLYQAKGRHIVTLKTEHVSVLDCCQQLEKEGFSVTYLTPEANGQVDIDKLRAALRPDTILVSIMQVNNETGVIQDIQAIADLTSNKGILLHVDAAQSAGKLSIDLTHWPVDLMSFCAHKVYGPKGIGALYVRRKPRINVAAQMHGGGHEQGKRSGTLPVHQIVGMGTAFQLAQQDMQKDQAHIENLRNLFWSQIQALPNVTLNSDLRCSLPNILNLSFADQDAVHLMRQWPELAISAGSACHAKGTEPSYVLRALGQSDKKARSALRFSFGRFTSVHDINEAVKQITSL